MGPDQYKNEKWDPDPNQNISNPPHWLCLHNSFTVQITKKNFFHILLQLFLGQFATIFLDDPWLSFLLNYLFYIFVLFFFYRYVYRFVCDLQHLLGYTPAQLHAMAQIIKYESGASGAEF